MSQPDSQIMKDTTFHHVCNLERPLAAARNFATGIALISETLDERGASSVQQISAAMIDAVAKIEAEYSTLFQLTHPDRDRFEREGWPTDKAAGALTHKGAP
jgi:hypothetical protein